jgi:2-dehydro-3-deoxy-D-arabinonate dehydratase
MQLCKVQQPQGGVGVGVVDEGNVWLLPGAAGLSDVLHADHPVALVRSLLPERAGPLPLEQAQLLAPIDAQEVWAAGVTYVRSKAARQRESAAAATFYDLVYTAERPELFFKATARRVVGPGGPVRIRADSRWNVPEPEMALVISPQLHIVGFTIGNDMSSRDIEGANPLYLPQAKVYDGSCALGPVVTLAGHMPPPEETVIRLSIRRGGAEVYEGHTTVAAMARSFSDLVSWLSRDNSFPDGVVLLTGTGVVPPDSFTLEHGDEIAIEVSGIGRLVNTVQ